MDKYKQLIEAARAKRDAAIQKAREDYRSTVKQIKAIQATLEPRKSSLKGIPKPTVPLRSKIYDAIPKDSHFTVADIANWLGLEHAATQVAIGKLRDCHRELKAGNQDNQGAQKSSRLIETGKELTAGNHSSSGHESRRDFGQVLLREPSLERSFPAHN